MKEREVCSENTLIAPLCSGRVDYDPKKSILLTDGLRSDLPVSDLLNKGYIINK